MRDHLKPLNKPHRAHKRGAARPSHRARMALPARAACRSRRRGSRAAPRGGQPRAPGGRRGELRRRRASALGSARLRRALEPAARRHGTSRLARQENFDEFLRSAGVPWLAAPPRVGRRRAWSFVTTTSMPRRQHREAKKTQVIDCRHRRPARRGAHPQPGERARARVVLSLRAAARVTARAARAQMGEPMSRDGFSQANGVERHGPRRDADPALRRADEPALAEPLRVRRAVGREAAADGESDFPRDGHRPGPTRRYYTCELLATTTRPPACDTQTARRCVCAGLESAREPENRAATARALEALLPDHRLQTSMVMRVVMPTLRGFPPARALQSPHAADLPDASAPPNPRFESHRRRSGPKPRPRSREEDRSRIVASCTRQRRR